MAFTVDDFIAEDGVDKILQRLTNPDRVARQQDLLDFGTLFNKNDAEMKAFSREVYQKAQAKKAELIEQAVQENTAAQMQEHNFVAMIAPQEIEKRVRAVVLREAAKRERALGINSPAAIEKSLLTVRRSIFDDNMVIKNGRFVQDGWLSDKKLADRPNKAFPREPLTDEKVVEWGFNDMMALKENPNADLNKADGLTARLNQKDDGLRRNFRMDFGTYLNRDNPGLAALSEKVFPMLQDRINAVANQKMEEGIKEYRKEHGLARVMDDAWLTVAGWAGAKGFIRSGAEEIRDKALKESKIDPKAIAAANEKMEAHIKGYPTAHPFLSAVNSAWVGMTGAKGWVRSGAEAIREAALEKATPDPKGVKSAEDVYKAFAGLRSNTFDHDYVKTAEGSFKKGGMLANADGPRGAPVVAAASTNATDSVPKTSIEAEIDAGMRANPLAAGMTARKPIAIFVGDQSATVARKTINAWAEEAKRTVIIGNERFDMSKSKDVAELQKFAGKNYQTFLGGQLADTAKLAAAEKAQLALNQKTPETQIPANPAAVQNAAGAPPSATVARQPVSLISRANATLAPASAEPASAEKREPTAEAITQQARDDIARKKGYVLLAKAYLTGENLPRHYNRPEVKDEFMANIIAATKANAGKDYDHGKITQRNTEYLRDFLKQEKEKISAAAVKPNSDTNIATR